MGHSSSNLKQNTAVRSAIDMLGDNFEASEINIRSSSRRSSGLKATSSTIDEADSATRSRRADTSTSQSAVDRRDSQSVTHSSSCSESALDDEQHLANEFRTIQLTSQIKEDLDSLSLNNSGRADTKVTIVFSWKGDGFTVFVAGSFNNWTKIPMSWSGDKYVTIVQIEPGTYNFKYFVDNEWKVDPNTKCVENSYGTLDNVLVVSSQDANLDLALKQDEDAASPTSKYQKSEIYSGRCSPPGEYSQVIPRRPSINDAAIPFEMMTPPALPAFFNKGVINRTASSKIDPSILPAPNPVQLKHLYALSIKDGVAMLSMTNRHRSKCSTIIYCKSILS